MTVRESYVEAQIGKYVKYKKGLYLKLGQNGLPDRIIILKGPRIAFLEIKRPGGKPTKLQHYYLRTLSALGCNAGWVDNVLDGKKFIDNMEQDDG